jgi:hypothetical protein
VYKSEIATYGEPTTMWAEYHPEFKNTLVGLNLLFSDAMFIDMDSIRQASRSLNKKVPDYNLVRINKLKSKNSMSFIDRIFIRFYPDIFDSYIYTDYGTSITYQLDEGKIVFTGTPAYQFIRFDHAQEVVIIMEELTKEIKDNYNRVRDLNPAIYSTAEKTAQWAAFFRMVRGQNMNSWNTFINQIVGIVPQPEFETPRAWEW